MSVKSVSATTFSALDETLLTDMSDRVEHQNLNQVAAQLPPGWVFGVQLDYSFQKSWRRGPDRAVLLHILNERN